MRADIAWWELDGTSQTVDSLRERLRNDETVETWTHVPGLVGKFWIADRQTNRWGAVMLWEHDNPGAATLPPNHAARLIGGPPTHRASFDVEAVASGTVGPALVSFGRDLAAVSSAVTDHLSEPQHGTTHPGSPRHA